MRSMTGFASKNISLSLEDNTKIQVTLSIKSLNSRFFEVTARLPYPLSNLETDITKILKKKLLRGHIYITMYTPSANAFKSAVEPSLPLINDYMNAIQTIKTTCNIPGELNISDVIQLPNIFNLAEKSLSSESKDAIFNVLDELIIDVIDAQKEEGDTLYKDIIGRIDVMKSEMGEIEKNSHAMIEAQKLKINDHLKDINLDENALADMQKNTLYSLLDKMDIHEEIVRFNSHLHNLEQHLSSSPIEKGKRIDFTLQELAREINTISAKCSDATIGAHAINIKVEVEKAREQAQNIV